MLPDKFALAAVLTVPPETPMALSELALTVPPVIEPAVKVRAPATFNVPLETSPVRIVASLANRVLPAPERLAAEIAPVVPEK